MDLGNVRPIAKGCAGSNNKTPTMVYGGSPYQGNSSFRLRMEGGMPNALVHAVLGLDRLDVDLTVIVRRAVFCIPKSRSTCSPT